MRVAVLACAGCGGALDLDDLIWCAPCVPHCDNCGASDHEAGPFDLVTGECLDCKRAAEDDALETLSGDA